MHPKDVISQTMYNKAYKVLHTKNYIAHHIPRSGGKAGRGVYSANERLGLQPRE
jgi:hypothetical protein